MGDGKNRPLLTTMETDNQLLESYANRSSEPAFRELVQRHINLVYTAALRETNSNSALAEDIAQSVFTELARRARELTRHPALAGWLYSCVRRMAANMRRAEIRRHRRELEAISMNELLAPDPHDQLWEQLRPVLDDVMHELAEPDRAAVVLRFFEGRPLKEVGVALGLTENAARMRVERALAKLNALLSRRGIKSTTSTLAAALGVGAVLSAPAALGATIASSALLDASGVGAAAHGAGKLLSVLKLPILSTGALVLLFVTGTWARHFRGHGLEPKSATTQTLALASDRGTKRVHRTSRTGAVRP
jgi:RNA polymerase sigma factor (sigma-70 family)